MAAEQSSPSRGQAWFCSTNLPSDIIVEVDDMTFHLHKFPLISKSKKLHDLITDQETNQTLLKGKKTVEVETYMDHRSQDNDVEPGEVEEGHDQVIEQEQCYVSLPSIPGGSDTFVTAVKFCYGVKIELTAGEVVPLRCAGEVLQMTEEHAEDNLISKTEKFLRHSVLKNIKDSIMALKSCESLCPMAENLGIVQRCIDAISSKASLYDPTLFGWPVNEPGRDFRSKIASPTKLRDPWVEDLAKLREEYFNRVISAIRVKEYNPGIVESCLMHYAKRCFPGISLSCRKTPSASPLSIASEAEQRRLLENIVSNLPLEKSSRSTESTRFLFGLLRTANILNASDACKSALERKISAKLEQATLDDLLIPSYSYLSETLYDVNCVQRMLHHFLESYEEREIEHQYNRESRASLNSPAIMIVGKLIDGYLSEIASDSNLKPEKFYELATFLPEQTRLYDDGVYRAIDVYLKAHPWITEGEREKISRVMNCQKLTLEACTHAAQNERLPLRLVVQVLYFEQQQLRCAIAGTLIAADTAPLTHGRASVEDSEEEERESAGTRSSSRWREAVRENQVLRLEMDSMRNRVKELERECSTMKKVIEKIDKTGKGWRSKFGCKLKTEVCNSRKSTAVGDRKIRRCGNSC